MPEGWDENADRLRQKDLDARWVKKYGISHYGYKNSICVDVDHCFIRRYAVTPASIHDSQMIAHLLDPEDEHDFVWADSAYSGECIRDLLDLAGFESLIHEKGVRNHPLGDAAKELNHVKSAIRACVEHVFGCMTMSMGGKLTRKIGLARTVPGSSLAGSGRHSGTSAALRQSNREPVHIQVFELPTSLALGWSQADVRFVFQESQIRIKNLISLQNLDTS